METPQKPQGYTFGRPTKYRDEFVEEAYKYLKHSSERPKTFPSLEGFASWLGVDHESIVSWANKRLKDEQGNITKKLARPDFFVAIKRIRNAQKERLMIDGMYMGKDINASMAIFLLKVNHNMIETNHTDVTTKGKELPTPLLGGATNVPADNSTK